MCIDGTKKFDEEMLSSGIAGKSIQYKSVDFSQFAEVKEVNDRLALEMDIPVLMLAVKKNRPGHIAELHEQLCALSGLQAIKMILYVDDTIGVADIADTLWRLCNNLDPKRDHIYSGKQKNIIGLDGTRKTKELDGFDRPWPNIIVADDTTIKSVDAKWSQLGLGALIPSPSLKYKGQMYGEEAEVN